VLATFAGRYFLRVLSVAKLVIPDLAAALFAGPQRPGTVPPLLAVATLEFPVGSCRPVIALDSASWLPIEPAPLPEEPLPEMDV